MSTALQRTTYQGKPVNRKTFAILIAANKILQKSPYFGRERSNVTLVQGSYNRGGVAQSAGTHDGGGAIDVTAFNITNRSKIYRMLGIRFWPRATLPGYWQAHGHGIVSRDSSVSRGGHAQRVAYANGRDGLAGNRRDPNWRPDRYDTSFICPWESGGGIGTFYVKKTGTLYRSQPGSGCGVARGRARKNQKVTIVAWVYVYAGNNRNRYAVTDRGNWFPAAAISRKKSK